MKRENKCEYCGAAIAATDIKISVTERGRTTRFCTIDHAQRYMREHRKERGGDLPPLESLGRPLPGFLMEDE